MIVYPFAKMESVHESRIDRQNCKQCFISLSMFLYRTFLTVVCSGSHAFVKFFDDANSTSVVPMDRVSFKGENAERCLVKWTNGKQYEACLLFTGNKCAIINR